MDWSVRKLKRAEMPKNRNAITQLDKETYIQLLDCCEELNCSRNAFLKKCIRLGIDDYRASQNKG